MFMEIVALGGLAVGVLSMGLKVAGSNPAVASGGEVKPSVPCRRFTACRSIPQSMIEKNFCFSPAILLILLLRYQMALVDESG
jgi:hypothetical protein